MRTKTLASITITFFCIFVLTARLTMPFLKDSITLEWVSYGVRNAKGWADEQLVAKGYNILLMRICSWISLGSLIAFIVCLIAFIVCLIKLISRKFWGDERENGKEA